MITAQTARFVETICQVRSLQILKLLGDKNQAFLCQMSTTINADFYIARHVYFSPNFFLPFLLLSLFLVLHSSLFDVSSDGKWSVFYILYFQMESGQGNLGTLANVVTSLANLSDSLKENLNNGSASDSQQEEQSASDITRLEQLHSTHTLHIL